MRNEFEDELGRNNGDRKRDHSGGSFENPYGQRRGSYSEQGPSEGDYYLDEDYAGPGEEYQGGTAGMSGDDLFGQNPAGRAPSGVGRQPAPGNGQGMFRGENTRPAGQSASANRPNQASHSQAPFGERAQNSGRTVGANRMATGNPAGMAGTRNGPKGAGTNSGLSGGPKGAGANFGLGGGQKGAGVNSGLSGGQKGAGVNSGLSGGQKGAGANSGLSGGQKGAGVNSGLSGGPKGTEGTSGLGGNQRVSGTNQGMFRGQTVSGKGQEQSGNRNGQRMSEGQTRSQMNSDSGQESSKGHSGQNLSRNQTAAGSARSQGQIMIGDGGQQPKSGGRDNPPRAAGSRCAAQAEKKKKIRRAIIMAVAEVFTLALIFSYAYVSRIMGTIQRPEEFDKNQVQNEVLTAAQKKHMTGYRTVAVFGVDSRDGNVNRGTNADVIMICNIDRDTGEIKLVSVFRDTYLNISDSNTYNKINSAYANGGASQALAALNKNLDMDITEYVTFNWKAVADGINLLGGVDIDITKAEFKYINSFITETVEKTGVPSVHLKSAGMNHLDGVQAVAYGRLRLMDTDYARTERQRLIIEKSFEKAKKADLGLLNRILLTEVEQIGTNLTFSDFTELILDIGKYHIGETGGFPSARGDMKMGKKGDCVIPQTLETNVTELHKFLFGKEDYEPTDAVKKISAKIAADSGMYKKNGGSDRPAAEKNSTKETAKAEKTTASDEKESTPESAAETDEDGNPLKSSESSENSTKETKPGETKEETKSGETQKEDMKPGETKPGETKSGETKQGETKPGETKPGETKPGETKPGGTKPGEGGPSESKPASSDSTTEARDHSDGPGTAHTTAARETTEEETKPVSTEKSEGPGETSPSHTTSPESQENEIPIVPGPPG